MGYRDLVVNIIGIKLKRRNVIHHVDGNRDNNQNDNFVVCENAEYHRLLHARTKAHKECGNANMRFCERCSRWLPIDCSEKDLNGSWCADCAECVGESILFDRKIRESKRSRKKIIENVSFERTELYLPMELKQWFKDVGSVRGTSMATEMRWVLNEYIQKHGNKLLYRKKEGNDDQRTTN